MTEQHPLATPPAPPWLPPAPPAPPWLPPAPQNLAADPAPETPEDQPQPHTSSRGFGTTGKFLAPTETASEDDE